MPAALLTRTGADITVRVLAGPDPDLPNVDFHNEDDTGIWIFADEVPHQEGLVPGAVLRAADGIGAIAWVEVMDLVDEPTGRIAHLRLLPVLVVDDSMPPHPMGVPAWSKDDGNDTRGITHPLAVGDLMAERDMTDPPGTEMPTRVTGLEGDLWEGWTYRVLPNTDYLGVPIFTWGPGWAPCLAFRLHVT